MAVKIREWAGRLTKKQVIFSLTAFLSLIFFLCLSIWSGRRVNGLIDQQAAARWDAEGGSAQVSCFFAENVEMDEFKIMSFEKQLEQSLLEVLPASEQGGENGKRLFIDAYSSLGRITLNSGKGKLEASDPKNPKYLKVVWGVGYKIDRQ